MKKLYILLFFSCLFFSTVGKAQTITFTGFSPTPPFNPGVCSNISYNITGTFNVGNQFIAQLSDASGSFTTFTQIGFINSTTAIPISSCIPCGTIPGNGYRIRIISTNPVVTSTTSIQFTINTSPAANFSFSPNNTCSSTPIAFTNLSTGSGLISSWNFGDGSPVNSAFSPSHTFSSALGNLTQTFSVSLTVSNSSNCNSIITIPVTVKQSPDAQLRSSYLGTLSTEFVNFPNNTTPTLFKECNVTPPHHLELENLSSTWATNTSYDIAWGFPTPDYISSTFGTPSNNYQLGAYILTNTVTGANGCISVKNYDVYIGNAPILTSISALQNVINDCAPQTYDFLLTYNANDTPGTLYIISSNDGTPPDTLINPLPPPAAPYLPNQYVFSHTFAFSSCGIISPLNSFLIQVQAKNGCDLFGLTSGLSGIRLNGKPYPIFDGPQFGCVGPDHPIPFSSSSIHGNYINPTTLNCDPSILNYWQISPGIPNNEWTVQPGSSLGTSINYGGTSPLNVVFNTPGTYFVSLNTANADPLSCPGDSAFTDTICISPVPVPIFSLDQTSFCLPDTVVVTNTTDTLDFCRVNYSWNITCTNTACGGSNCNTGYSFVGGTNLLSHNPKILFSKPGIYKIKLTVNNGCSVTSAEQTITIKDKPIPNFSVPTCPMGGICPTSVVANCYGTPPLTYLWTSSFGTFPNSTALVPGCIPIVQGNQTISFTASNECGDSTLTRNINVNPNLVITPADTIAFMCIGGSTSLSASSTIPGTTFSWTAFGFSATGTPITVTPATTTTYTVTGTTPGGCTASATVTVIVTSYPTITTVLPNISVCGNTVIPATNLASNPIGASYVWTNTETSIGLAASGSGNVPLFTATNITSSLIIAVITVTPSLNGCLGNSTSYFIIVKPAPIVAVPSNIVVCNDDLVAGTNFISTPSGASFTWTNSNTTIGLAQSSGSGNVPPISATNITNAPITATITVTPTLNSCVGASSSYTITVNPTPSVTVSSNIVVCNNGSVAATNLTTSPAGGTIAWTNSNTTIGLAPSGTGSIAGFTAINTTNVPIIATITVTPTLNSCSGTSPSYTITVNPTPTVTVPLNIIVCNNDLIAATNFITSPSGGTIAWTNSNTAIGLVASGTGNIIGFTATNTTNAPITATITVTPTLNSCQGIPRTYTITVKPTPIVIASVSQSIICSGISDTLSAVSNIAGTTYFWQPVSMTGTPITVIPLNTTIYTVIGTATGCTGTATVSITINSGTTVAVPPNIVVCPNTLVPATNFISTPNGATFAWTNSNTTIGLAQSSGSGNVPPIMTTNTGATAITSTIQVTPTLNGCGGASSSYTITVNPKPALTNMTASVCTGDAFAVTPVNITNGVVPAGTTYTWGIPVVGGITGGAAGSGTNINGTLINSTNIAQTAIYTVTPTSPPTLGSCPGSPFTLTITVNPKPAISNMTATVCSAFAFTVTPANVTNGVVPIGTKYSWSAPTVTGGMTGGASGTNAVNISGALINTTTIAQTATYIVTPTTSVALGSCVGDTFMVVIKVNPRPNITAMTTSVCSGSTFTVTPINIINGIVPVGTTYSWGIPAPTGGITGGAASGGSQANILGTLNNPTNTAQTATYTVTPTSSVALGSCPGATFTVTVTVNPKPAINPISTTVCSGTPFTVTPANVTNGIVPAGTTYSWPPPTVTGGMTGGTPGTDAANISGTIINTTTIVQTATYLVTPTSSLVLGSCPGSMFTVTVTVNPKPDILPMTDSVCSGSLFTLTPNITNGVIPAGTTYIWGIPAVIGGITGGAASMGPQTNISGTLNNPTNIAHAATYTVTPTSGSAGNCVGSNFTITVTVNPTPAINTINASSVCSGVGFSVSPTNSTNGVVPIGTNYCWAAPSGSGIIGGIADCDVNINGVLSTAPNTPASAIYIVTPTSSVGLGSCQGQAFIVIVPINPIPTVIVPNSIVVCNNGFVAATNFISPTVGATFTWTNSNTSIGLAASGSGDIIGFPAINTTSSPIIATIIVTPTANGCIGIPSSYTITVNPTDNPSFNYTPSIMCQTGIDPSANFTGGATGGFTAIPGGLVFLNTTTGFIDVSASSINSYIVTFTTNGLCPSSSTTTVTITSSPSASFNYAGPYCPDGIDPLPNFVSPASAGVFSAPVGLVINPTTGQVDLSASTAGTYTVMNSIAASGGCLATSASNTIIINPTPTVIVPADIAVCNNGVVLAANFVSNPVGGTYVWTNSNTSIGLGASGNGNISGFIASNTSTAQIVATIIVTPTVNGCLGTPSSYTVTVNPIPTVTVPANIVVCNNDVVPASNLMSTPLGGTFAWTNSNTAIGLSISGNGNIPLFTATNTTNAPITATITVTPTVFGCVGTPSNYTITVNPTPTVTVPLNIIVCNNAFVAATNFITIPFGGTIDWTNSNATIGLASNGTGNIVGFTATNITNSQITATITVTPTVNDCVGTPSSYTITVNPSPPVSIIANPTAICEGQCATLSVSGADTYSWASNPLTICPATTSTYSVVGTSSITNCSAMATSTITVNPLPVASFTSPAQQGCVDIVIFTNTSIGANTYHWDFGDNNTSTLFEPTHIYTPSSTGFIVELIAFSGAGCSDTVTDTLYQPFVNAGNDLMACVGDPPLHLFGLPNAGTWSGCCLTDSIFTIGAPGIYTMMYSVSFQNCIKNDYMTVTVNALPDIDVGNDTIACLNELPFFLNSSPAGGVWLGSGVVPPPYTLNPLIAGIGADTLTYTYTDIATQCSGSAIKVINVLSVPSVDAGVDSIFCDSDASTQLIGSPIGGTWTGPCVDSSGIFFPCGVGLFNLVYCYTAPGGCTECDGIQVSVVHTVDANAGHDTSICISTPSVQLIGMPLGGTWSLPATPSGLFIVTDTGTYQAVYSINNINCVTTDTVVITVLPLPVVEAGNDYNVCINFAPFYLSDSLPSPMGGYWSSSGNGVINDQIFDPSLAGIGCYTLTYHYTDQTTQCTSSDNIIICVYSLPYVGFWGDSLFCVNTPPTQLTHIFPDNGYWSGPGVSPGGIFYPDSVGIGSFYLYYCYDEPNGCSNCDTVLFTIIQPIPPDAGNDTTICVSTQLLQLHGLPLGGTWGSPVTPSGLFSVTDTGTFHLVYYNDNGVCATTDTIAITIIPLPVVNIPNYNQICIDDNPFYLSSLLPSPMGGEWSGTGVINNQIFDPSILGIGCNTLTYTYTDPLSPFCSNFANMTMCVFDLPIVEAGPNQEFCVSDALVQLNATTPAGGGWGLPAYSSGEFHPDSIGQGTYYIRYYFTAPNGCTNYDSIKVTVLPLVVANAHVGNNIISVCVGSLPDTLHGAPIGGTWTGPNIQNDSIHYVGLSGIDTLVYCPPSTTCAICDTIYIKVNPLPEVTNIPLSQTICSGAPTTLVTLTSDVIGATFTWTASATPGVSGFAASGTNVIPFQTISTTGTTQGTVTYVITPLANNCYGTPVNYTVIVNPLPYVTNTPISQTICSGDYTTFVTLASDLSGATFAWTASATSGVSGFTASGTDVIPIQTISTIGTAQGTVTYVITPTANMCQGPILSYTILVNPSPIVTNSPVSQTICSGASTTLVTLNSNIIGTAFAWTAVGTAGVSGFMASGTSTIPVQTISTTGNTLGTVTYTITPTATGCAGTVSTYTVYVNPTPTVSNIPLSQTICSGANTILVPLTSNVAGATLSWTASATIGVTGYSSSGTGSISVQTISTTQTTQGTVSYIITPSVNGCTGSNSNYTVLVNPLPHVTNTPLSQIICSGDETDPIIFTSDVSGVTYTWTGLGSIDVYGVSASGTDSIPIETIYNFGIILGAATYAITPTASGCDGPIKIYTILVNPLPNVITTPLSQTICSGDSTTMVTLSSDVFGTTFTWTASGIGVSAGFTTSGTNFIPAQIISNNGTTPGTVMYVIIPSANNCYGPPVNYSVIVNPLPHVTNTPITQTICSGGTSTLVTLTSDVSGATFAWTATGTAGVSGFTTSGTTTIPVQTISTSLTTQGTVTYLITPWANGCQGPNYTYTVLVNPGPIVTNSPVSQTICSGASTTLVTLTSDITGATFAWTATGTAGVSGFATSGMNTIPIQTISTIGNTQGTVTYTITPTTAGCAGTVSTYKVYVDPTPTVSNALLTQTICSGTNTTFVPLTSNVAGAALSWTASATIGVTGYSPSGTGSIPVQTISTTQTTLGTVTYVTIPTANGCIGSPINYTVLVNPLPHVTNTPLSDTICSGDGTNQVILTSDVSGTTYTWTGSGSLDVYGVSAGNSGNIPIETIYYLENLQGTATYTITPTANGCVGPITIYTVIVNPLPEVNNTSLSQTICSGDTTTLVSLTSDVSGTTFTWNATGTLGVSGFTTSGMNVIPIQTLSTTGTSPGTVTYVITPLANNCYGPTVSYTVIVNPLPHVTNIPSWQTICSGQSTSFVTLTSDVIGTTFAWTPTATLGVTGFTGSGTVSIPVQTISTSEIAQGSVMYVITPTANGCPGPDSTYTVFVNPSPIVTNAPLSQTICSGASTTLVILNSNITSTTFAWTATATAGVSGFTASGTNTIPVQTITTTSDFQGYVTYTITPTAAGCIGTVSTYRVYIDPTPTVSNTSLTQTICSGDTTTFVTLTSDVLGTTFAWTASATPGVNGYTASGTGTILGQTIFNHGNTVGIVTYIITPSANVCPGTTSTYTVLVNPLPNVTNTPLLQTICSGNNTALVNLTSNVSGATFTWTGSETGVSGVSASGVGNIPIQTIYYLGTLQGTATYTITPTANGCVGPDTTYTVFVNPLPNVIMTPPPPQTICSGAPTALVTLSSDVFGTTFAWTATGTVGVSGFAASGNNVIPIQTISTTETSLGTVTYVITPLANNCYGTPVSYTVLVNPLPHVTNTPISQTICSGGSTVLVTLTSDVNGATFTWVATATPFVSGFASSGTSTIPVQTILTSITTQGTVTYIITPWADGCQGPVYPYTVLVNPGPIVTNAPLSQTICSGAATALVTLTSDITGATFTWTATGTAGISGFTVSGTNTIPIQTITTTGNTQGSVTYTIMPTAAGCTGAVSTYTVYVNPTPTVINTLFPQTICSGENTTLVAFTPNVIGTVFNWSASGTFGVTGYSPSGTGSIPVQTISTTQTTQGSVTYIITPSANGCTGPTSTYTVFVNPLPLIVMGDSLSVCIDNAYFPLTGTLLGGIWGPNPPITPSGTFNFPFVGTYSVYYNYGCAVADTIHITVYDITSVDAGNDVTSCIFDSSFYLGPPSLVGGIWSGPGIGGGTDPIMGRFSPSDAGIGFHTITYTYLNPGCGNSSDVVHVTVKDVPQITITASPLAGCVPLTVNFTNSPPLASTYHWDFGDGDTSNMVSPTHLFSTSGTFSLIVTASNVGNCTNSDTISIDVYPLPTDSIIGGPFVICDMTDITFTATTFNGGVNFDWYFQGWGSATGNPVTVNYSYPGGPFDVNLTVTSAFGCINTTTYPNYVTVLQSPDAHVSVTPDMTTMLYPSVVGDPSGTIGATSWYWNFGDPFSGNSNYSTLENPLPHDYSEPGIYAVTLYVENSLGCKDSAVTYVTIDDIFALYVPNAFTPNENGLNDVFKVAGRGIDLTTFKMRIFNRWGTEIWMSADLYEGWDGRIHGDESPQGVYVYVVTLRDLNHLQHTYRGSFTLYR